MKVKALSVQNLLEQLPELVVADVGITNREAFI